MNSLDNILSGGEAAPAENEQQEKQVTQAEGEGQQQEPDASSQEGDAQGQQRMVPHEALHAEKQKVKRYTEQVADFEKSVTGLREQNSNLTRQVSELLQRLPKQEQQQPQAPDFFENPAAATRHEVQQAVTPQIDQISQALLANAKLIAGVKFTDEKVDEAERAFIAAMQSGKLDQGDYQRVVSSPNRYAAAVQWHQRQLAQAEIGDDPVAYRAKVEAELREKILAEGGQQQTQQRQATVLPSNLAGARNVGSRSGPAWSGPASLQDIFDRTRSTG